MITSAIEKQTSGCCSISLNPYKVFQTWNHEKENKKGKSMNIVVENFWKRIHLNISVVEIDIKF